MPPRTHVKKPQAYRVQVLDRAFQILNVLADESAGIGLTDISARLKLHKSTVHRLITVLENSRFVEKNTVTAKYHLGSRLMELGLSAVSRLDVYEVAGPYLRELVKETGETAHLAVLREGQVVSLINVESSQTLRTPTTVGTRNPAHCTSLGKAMLAFTAQQQVEDFLQLELLKSYTRKTITSRVRFKAELAEIRARGYAVDDEEREPGLRCIGAPVWDSSGEVVAAISVAGPVFRITRSRISALSRTVMRIAAGISASLGYRSPRVPQNDSFNSN
ncbi:MAG TPA: IclR family transcriptional regulator [Bryobacteraceae bacterium]|nr:IclR family transcriptional regulator [Bryobacteraceae bacterium]